MMELGDIFKKIEDRERAHEMKISILTKALEREVRPQIIGLLQARADVKATQQAIVSSIDSLIDVKSGHRDPEDTYFEWED